MSGEEDGNIYSGWPRQGGSCGARSGERKEEEEEEIAAVRLATDFLPLGDGHFVDRPRGRRRVGSIGFWQFIRCGRGEERGVIRREGGE